jgi:hypothetical protein
VLMYIAQVKVSQANANTTSHAISRPRGTESER